jgi:hypothetical protein
MGREDDDIKVDNVICRTPARNAQNLDAVKNEILEMVERAVSEVQIIVFVNSNAGLGLRVYLSDRQC